MFSIFNVMRAIPFKQFQSMSHSGAFITSSKDSSLYGWSPGVFHISITGFQASLTKDGVLECSTHLLQDFKLTLTMSDIRFSEASLEIQALFYSTFHPTRSVTHVNVKNTLCSLCETQKITYKSVSQH